MNEIKEIKQLIQDQQVRESHRLIVEGVNVIPGAAPDGTLIGMFLIETANIGDLQWMLSPRQAMKVAAALAEYAHEATR
jgi:hypothetical protein